MVVGLLLGEFEDLFYPGAQAAEGWPLPVPPSSFRDDRGSCGRPVACDPGVLVAVDQAVPNEIGFRRTDQGEHDAERGDRDAGPDGGRPKGRTDRGADTESEKDAAVLAGLRIGPPRVVRAWGFRFQHEERVNPGRSPTERPDAKGVLDQSSS
ncbi:hypothetical protein [Micromonospora inositola]|uniref:hypothetical protein n=1 Tax=Micromonospora inositola TaxID=47865 RepID=UPI000B5B0771|nr:hypothetical protein [Micromonospora inositola]